MRNTRMRLSLCFGQTPSVSSTMTTADSAPRTTSRCLTPFCVLSPYNSLSLALLHANKSYSCQMHAPQH